MRDEFSNFFVDIEAHGFEKEVGEQLSLNGVCTFQAKTKTQLIQLIGAIGSPVIHGGTDENGIMTIYPDPNREKKIGKNGGAYGRDVLPFHTDGKGITECVGPNGEKRYGPADILILHAQNIVNPEEAIPVISDGQLIYQGMLSHHPEMAEYLTGSEAVKEYTTLPNHTYAGPLIELIRGKVAIRLDVDLCGHWPAGYFDTFMRIAQIHAHNIVLHTGSGYILDNRRMIHGRGPIGENNLRTLHHTLVYPDQQTSIGKHLFHYSLRE